MSQKTIINQKQKLRINLNKKIILIIVLILFSSCNIYTQGGIETHYYINDVDNKYESMIFDSSILSKEYLKDKVLFIAKVVDSEEYYGYDSTKLEGKQIEAVVPEIFLRKIKYIKVKVVLVNYNTLNCGDFIKDSVIYFYTPFYEDYCNCTNINGIYMFWGKIIEFKNIKDKTIKNIIISSSSFTELYRPTKKLLYEKFIQKKMKYCSMLQRRNKKK